PQGVEVGAVGAGAPAADGAFVPQAAEIDLATFQKVDLRVVTVLAAERIKGADRLPKLQLDLGYEYRLVVAVIAQHYQPEELVGRQVVVVANLKPVKLRGEISKGMILAATGPDGKLGLLTTETTIAPGSKVK